MQNAVGVVQQFLSQGTATGIRLGEPKSSSGLTLIPVFHEGPAADYLLFSEAVASGVARVAEVDAAGEVPALMVHNQADLPLLLVQGEIFAGMKQNRVINTTVLVAANSAVQIPVSCVEVGRWHEETAEASRDELNLSPRIRARMGPDVAASVRSSGMYAADQGSVWEGVEECLQAHDVASPTRAYSDLNRSRGVEIDAFLTGIKPLPGQKGVVAFVGGRPICLDVFDRSSTLSTLWKGLVGSYYADALAQAPGSEEMAGRLTSDWLVDVKAARASQHEGVGIGYNVVRTQAALSANSLVVSDAVVHLAAFLQDPKSSDGPEFAPRRRFMA